MNTNSVNEKSTVRSVLSKVDDTYVQSNISTSSALHSRDGKAMHSNGHAPAKPSPEIFELCPSKPEIPLYERIIAVESELQELWKVFANYIERRNNDTSNANEYNPDKMGFDWSQAYLQSDDLLTELQMVLRKVQEAPKRLTINTVPTAQTKLGGRRNGGFQEIERLKTVSIQAQTQARRLELEKLDLVKEVERLKGELEQATKCIEDEKMVSNDDCCNGFEDSQSDLKETEENIPRSECENKTSFRWISSSIGIGIGVYWIGMVAMSKYWNR